MIEERTGRCACGAVTVRAQTPKTFGVCHCRMCRAWAGGVWMGVVAQDAPDVTGPIKIWDSSRIAQRASCGVCGSNVWHKARLAKYPTFGLGLFDDQDGWTMNRQIFTEQQPAHYGFGASAPGFTGWGTVWALVTGRLPK